MTFPKYLEQEATRKLKADLKGYGKFWWRLRAFNAYSSSTYEFSYEYNKVNPFAYLMIATSFFIAPFYAIMHGEAPKEILDDVRASWDQKVNKKLFPNKVKH